MITKPNIYCEHVCFWLLVLINATGLLFAVAFACEFESIALKIFAAAFSVWQLTNTVVSSYYIYSHCSNEHVKAYIRLNMYLMASLSVLVLVGAIVWWILYHCVGTDCYLNDAVPIVVILFDVIIGLCGTMTLKFAFDLNHSVEIKYHEVQ